MVGGVYFREMTEFTGTPDPHAHPTIETLTAHARFARSLARSLLRDEHAAEDVVQDAYVKALSNPPGTNPRSWLATVTRRLSLNARRAEARRVAREAVVVGERTSGSPAEIAERRESLRRVMDAVLTLDEPYRSVVLMRFYEDLQPTVIAGRLGVPAATVRTQLRRALAQLRGALDVSHNGDRRAWSVALLPLVAGARSPIGGATMTAMAAGGVAMGLGVKVMATAVVVSLCGLAWWTLQDSEPLPLPPVETQTASPPEDETSRMRARVKAKDVDDDKPSIAARIDTDAAGQPTRSVRVLSAAGTPIPGAFVAAFRGSRIVATGRTDDTGTLGLWVASTAQAVIVASGRPPVVTGLADTFTSITLEDGLRVDGIVRVDGSAPRHKLRLALRTSLPTTRVGDIPDAVRAKLREHDIDARNLHVDVGSDGRFTFVGLPRETAARFRLPPGYEVDGRDTVPIEVPAQDVVLELTALPLLRGRVLDVDDNPVAKATLSVSIRGSNGVATEVVRRAKSNGRFELALPTRFAAGLSLRAMNPDGQDATTIELGAVEPGVRDLGDVKLTSAPRRRVIVRDTEGAPIDDAFVGVPYSVKSIAGPSGLDGALMVPLRDGEAKVVIGAIGYVPVERSFAKGETGPVEVTLTRTPVLSLTVEGTSEALPAGLVASIRTDDGTPAVALDDRLANVLVAAGAARPDFAEDPAAPTPFFVDGHGRARMAVLRPGTWLTVTLVDHLGVEHGSERLRLPMEHTRELTMTITRTVRRVIGRVTDPTGNGIASANVRLSSSEHDGHPLVTDSDGDGHFAIDGVAAEKLRFLVSAERHAMRSIEGIDLAESGDAPLAIELQPATTVRVEVYLANGDPAAKALISMLLPMPGASGRSLSRLGRKVEDGVYELRDVPHEPVNVRVRVNGEKHAFTIDGREPTAILRIPAGD